jgi:hypothetical protein
MLRKGLSLRTWWRCWRKSERRPATITELRHSYHVDGQVVTSPRLLELCNSAQQDVEHTAKKWSPSQVSRPIGLFNIHLILFYFAGIISFPAIAAMASCSIPLVPNSSHPYPHPRATPFIRIGEQQFARRHSSCLPVLSLLPLPPPQGQRIHPAPTRYRLPLPRPRLN